MKVQIFGKSYMTNLIPPLRVELMEVIKMYFLFVQIRLQMKEDKKFESF
jgi:septum formation topological specificity factor MinE